MKYDVKKIYSWPLSIKIFILLCLMLFLLYVAYLYDFSSFKIKFASNALLKEDLKQQFEILYKQQTALSDEIINFKALANMLKEWQKKLITKQDLPGILNEILKFGTANGLYFTSFTPDLAVPEDTYLKIPIKINAIGSYAQIASFISQIANMKYIVTIGDLIISKPTLTSEEKKSTDNPTGNRLTLEMIVEVYQLA